MMPQMESSHFKTQKKVTDMGPNEVTTWTWYISTEVTVRDFVLVMIHKKRKKKDKI